jgi:hypothetical protein
VITTAKIIVDSAAGGESHALSAWLELRTTDRCAAALKVALFTMSKSTGFAKTEF